VRPAHLPLFGVEAVVGAEAVGTGSLFAKDATVIDEGEERRGTAEVPAWQTGAASKYIYTTEITRHRSARPMSTR
jgi:hypothetical protein